MTFPLKPFLYLCTNSPKTYEQSAYTDYNKGVKALAEKLWPIIPEKDSYPTIPKELQNWACREIAAILQIKEEAIFFTFLELHLSSDNMLDCKPPSC